MSLSPASFTNSLIFGTRPSVRRPRRIVPICVSEPTGTECPCRTSSTPDITVVATAPMPGVSTPSFPFGGAILTGLRIQFPLILLLGMFACYLIPRAGWHKVRHHAASSPLLQIHSRFMRGFVGSLLWENRVATRFLQATRLSKRASAKLLQLILRCFFGPDFLKSPFVVIPSERSDEGSLPVSPQSLRSSKSFCF